MTSSNTSALVEGGYLKRDAPGISFITHTAPIVHHNSRIVGVCGILKEDSNPFLDGWFLSDFFALNYLMKGLGASQTWIATSSAEDLVKNYKEFLHGNSYRDRKVVLNEALLQRGEITPVTVREGTYCPLPPFSFRPPSSIYVSALINALSDPSSPLVESPNEDSSITGSIQPQAQPPVK